MMNELKIMAVGSSPLVASEITGIAGSLLAPSTHIECATTREVTAAAPNTLYVCANTQGTALARVLPPEQLYVFELEPITTFFLALARIPAGETVYIFNNLLAYTRVLATRCRELGLAELDFRPIAYDEMSEREVEGRLRAARYIIGVDIFVGEAVLQSERYKKYLAPDVTIIPGRRTASVASANRLLAAIATHYYAEGAAELMSIQQARAGITDTQQGLDGVVADTELATATASRENRPALAARLADLSAYITRAIADLQQSVLRTVTTQVVGSVVGRTVSSTPEPPTLAETIDDAIDTIRGQLRQLSLLREKINKLAR